MVNGEKGKGNGKCKSNDFNAEGAEGAEGAQRTRRWS
jgi:hypothetical protein